MIESCNIKSVWHTFLPSAGFKNFWKTLG